MINHVYIISIQCVTFISVQAHLKCFELQFRMSPYGLFFFKPSGRPHSVSAMGTVIYMGLLISKFYAILADTRNRSEAIPERSVELYIGRLAGYLLHRSRSAAWSNYPVLRGSKDLPRSQLYVVRVPVDPVHDSTRDMGHTDPSLTPHGQYIFGLFHPVYSLP